jgi:hypothetical protein
VSRRVRRHASRSALAGLIAFAGIAAVLLPAAASAQGLFDFLFGSVRDVPPASPTRTYAPHYIPPRPLDRHRSEGPAQEPGGPRIAYCVRLCDGRFFPVEAYRQASAATQCSSFCPASATKIFSGRGIEHAVAGDGRRYTDLPNAFVHRKRIVSDCTCDGKGTTGVAPQPVADDPTLRSGDIVAANSGLTIYRGKDSQRQPVFTPIESAKISKSLRNQLADVKVTPRQPTAVAPLAAHPQDGASTILGGQGPGARASSGPLSRATAIVPVPRFELRTD